MSNSSAGGRPSPQLRSPVGFPRGRPQRPTIRTPAPSPRPTPSTETASLLPPPTENTPLRPPTAHRTGKYTNRDLIDDTVWYIATLFPYCYGAFWFWYPHFGLYWILVVPFLLRLVVLRLDIPDLNQSYKEFAEEMVKRYGLAAVTVTCFVLLAVCGPAQCSPETKIYCVIGAVLITFIWDWVLVVPALSAEEAARRLQRQNEEEQRRRSREAEDRVLDREEQDHRGREEEQERRDREEEEELERLRNLYRWRRWNEWRFRRYGTKRGEVVEGVYDGIYSPVKRRLSWPIEALSPTPPSTPVSVEPGDQVERGIRAERPRVLGSENYGTLTEGGRRLRPQNIDEAERSESPRVVKKVQAGTVVAETPVSRPETPRAEREVYGRADRKGFRWSWTFWR